MGSQSVLAERVVPSSHSRHALPHLNPATVNLPCTPTKHASMSAKLSEEMEIAKNCVFFPLTEDTAHLLQPETQGRAGGKPTANCPRTTGENK